MLINSLFSKELKGKFQSEVKSSIYINISKFKKFSYLFLTQIIIFYSNIAFGEEDVNSNQVSEQIRKENFNSPKNSVSQNMQVPVNDLTNLGIRLDLGYRHDDNVSRSELTSDRKSDDIYGVRVSKNLFLPITDKTRLSLNGFLSLENFKRFDGLDNLSLGLQTELQFRPNGDFLSPIIGVFAKTVKEQFKSNMRDGVRYSYGLSYRQPITDRISLFGMLATNIKKSQSDVFDTKDNSGRLDLDYTFLNKSSMYLSYEHRKGDTVTTGPSEGAIADKNDNIADVSENDDVFKGNDFLSYRFKGKTDLISIGYNLPITSSSAIDFSIRHIESSPDKDADPIIITDFVGVTNYVINQVFLSYLVKF